MTADHLKPLTSMRFFAALWVVVYAYWPAMAAASSMPGLLARGFLGVELFFVLSGFILCHVYLPAAEDGRFRYGGFVWARIARVYPLHLATLLGIGLLAGAALVAGFQVNKDVLAWDALAANLLMVHAWGFAQTAGWNHPSWSISAEWFAYLAFPAFAWAAIKLRNRPLVAVTGALALMFGLYLVFEPLAGFPLTQATIAWGALRIIPCFALGCALYLLWRSGVVKGRRPAELGALGSLLVMAADAQFGAPDGVVVAAGGALILFLAACARNGSPIGSSRVAIWLGEVSYAVYMVAIPWQLAFVNGAQKLVGFQDGAMPAWLWIAYVISVVPVAAAAHHLVERPAREALRNWRRPPALVTPERRPA